MTLTFRSDMTVDYVDSMGSDERVVQAMLVSTDTVDAAADLERTPGRINWLMRDRHGSPFEHTAFTFYVEAPIFVFREWHRHRIGFSYNEMSGRYSELPPTFYVPAADRNLVQTGKPGHYIFTPGSKEQHHAVTYEIKNSCSRAYNSYVRMLENGVAKEVARAVLPVNTYSKMFVTLNARSLMSFLSLRTKDESSTFPSFPQREIEMCAEQVEDHFARLFPLTHAAFNQNGRVSP